MGVRSDRQEELANLHRGGMHSPQNLRSAHPLGNPGEPCFKVGGQGLQARIQNVNRSLLGCMHTASERLASGFELWSLKSGNMGISDDNIIRDHRSTFHVNRFRGGLLVEAHRRLHHSTLGSRVRKKKKRRSTLRRFGCGIRESHGNATTVQGTRGNLRQRGYPTPPPPFQFWQAWVTRRTKEGSLQYGGRVSISGLVRRYELRCIWLDGRR